MNVAPQTLYWNGGERRIGIFPQEVNGETAELRLSWLPKG
jgi:hypothetical protein